MKNVIVYPYSRYFTPFLRQMVKDNKYNILSSVIPGKWCIEGIDASFLDEGSTIGVPISTDFDKQLLLCSDVIWAEYDYSGNSTFFNNVLTKIKYAMSLNKNIVCCQKLTPDILCEFKELAEENNVKFEYIFKAVSDNISDIQYKDNKTISIPIITVMGIGENCSKFETQLILRRLFTAEGYRFSQIGSRQGCEILGFHSFPEFMFDNYYTETEKISAFRDFVYGIQQKEKNDFIIIGIPGEIMPYNDKHNNHYGITCYEVLSSIKSDFNILNIWNQQINNEFVGQLNNILKYKFCTTLDCIGVSNINLITRNKSQNDMEYCILDKDSIDMNIMSKLSVKAYNILEKKDQIAILYQIIDKLS